MFFYKASVKCVRTVKMQEPYKYTSIFIANLKKKYKNIYLDIYNMQLKF